jgi:hypothetical protein
MLQCVVVAQAITQGRLEVSVRREEPVMGRTPDGPVVIPGRISGANASGILA